MCYQVSAVSTKYLCKCTACSSTQTDLAMVQVTTESNVANQPRVVHQISQKPGPDITMLRKQHSDKSTGIPCTGTCKSFTIKQLSFSFTGRNYHKYEHIKNEVLYLDKLQRMQLLTYELQLWKIREIKPSAIKKILKHPLKNSDNISLILLKATHFLYYFKQLYHKYCTAYICKHYTKVVIT